MRLFFASALLALFAGASAEELPPLEAYGALPETSLITLSPCGRLVAFRQARHDEDVILVTDTASGEIVATADASGLNLFDLHFVADDRLVLVMRQTVRTWTVRRSFDSSEAHVLDVTSGEVRPLLHGADGLFPYQSGLGEIVAFSPELRTLYMPAFIDVNGDPRRGVFSVPLDATRERIIARGSAHTRDWLVDAGGLPIAREDFNDRENLFQIWAVDERGRQDRLLYSEYTEVPRTGFVGVTADYRSLVVRFVDEESDAYSYYLMRIGDGAVDGPILPGNGMEVRRIIADTNRVVHGVEYDGFVPSYAFFNDRLDARVKAIQERLRGVASRLVSWSNDFEKLVFKVEGGRSSGAYLLFEGATNEPRVLGYSRPGIAPEHVVPTERIDYAARDGLRIPALLTARDDVMDAGPAPTIVMPHGGPEAHDRFGFHWMAQYFASRGYVVLQPQFRGSDGFGQTLKGAGRGQWGSGMQYDIDDGAGFLVDEGIADPDRICILGWSYGGYAALWAGAFSPVDYRCVAAIAPVTDIPMMLRGERLAGGRNWVIDYWQSLYGAEASEKDQLREISPAYHADHFEAPVLLVHGRRDTVVRYEQSEVMEKALRNAGKDVRLVEFKSEDHWISQATTRIEMLRAVAEFIEMHL